MQKQLLGLAILGIVLLLLGVSLTKNDPCIREFGQPAPQHSLAQCKAQIASIPYCYDSSGTKWNSEGCGPQNNLDSKCEYWKVGIGRECACYFLQENVYNNNNNYYPWTDKDGDDLTEVYCGPQPS